MMLRTFLATLSIAIASGPAAANDLLNAVQTLGQTYLEVEQAKADADKSSRKAARAADERECEKEMGKADRNRDGKVNNKDKAEKRECQDILEAKAERDERREQKKNRD